MSSCSIHVECDLGLTLCPLGISNPKAASEMTVRDVFMTTACTQIFLEQQKYHFNLKQQWCGYNNTIIEVNSVHVRWPS